MTIPEDVAALAAPPNETLAGLPNVVESYLKPKITPLETEYDGLPQSVVGVNKAAVNTFQVWLAKSQSLVGMLFGEYQNKKYQSRQLVVANSLEDIWNDKKLAAWQTEAGMMPMGVVWPASLSDDEGSSKEWEDVRLKWCTALLALPGKLALFALVTCLSTEGSHLFCKKRHEFTSTHVSVIHIYIHFHIHDKYVYLYLLFMILLDIPEVDKSTGKLHSYEATGEAEVIFQKVKLRWVHVSNMHANICWLHHLGLSKRHLLYSSVCKVVMQHVGRLASTEPEQEAHQLLPFEAIRIAPDGKCAWRHLS